MSDVAAQLAFFSAFLLKSHYKVEQSSREFSIQFLFWPNCLGYLSKDWFSICICTLKKCIQINGLIDLVWDLGFFDVQESRLCYRCTYVLSLPPWSREEQQACERIFSFRARFRIYIAALYKHTPKMNTGEMQDGCTLCSCPLERFLAWARRTASSCIPGRCL